MPILVGEELSFSAEMEARIVNTPDEIINEKYVRGEVRIVTEQARYPLNTISGIVDSPAYKLSPEYQRRHRWNRQQQSLLIESLIINVPIPPIFLYEYDYSKYEVMDGLQRLTAIHAFYTNEFALQGLKSWPELNGRKYDDLPDKVREGIDRRYLSSVILLKETAKNDEDALRLKQMVFERLNSGGTTLAHQETRNAIYDGPLNQLCISLSKNESLCRLWGLPIAEAEEVDGGVPSQDRLGNEAFRCMDDVELVLRFFAFRQKQRLHRGAVPLSVYLDLYLRYGNGLSDSVLAELSRIFVDTVQLVEEVFGERAFWLYRNRAERWSWLERPTTTIYDTLMAVVSQNLYRSDEIRRSAAEIRGGVEAFYTDNYAIFEGRNVNPTALAAREAAFQGFLDASLAAI